MLLTSSERDFCGAYNATQRDKLENFAKFSEALHNKSDVIFICSYVIYIFEFRNKKYIL